MASEADGEGDVVSKVQPGLSFIPASGEQLDCVTRKCKNGLIIENLIKKFNPKLTPKKMQNK